uniref:Uncharacterized protein n=1 Tax=Anopheles quadriannulatus TaxID=34691 RepID=A0A182WXK5_ANOQN
MEWIDYIDGNFNHFRISCNCNNYDNCCHSSYDYEYCVSFGDNYNFGFRSYFNYIYHISTQ